MDRRSEWRRWLSSSTGFTVIEVLIVTALLALLAGIVLPELRAAGQQARCQAVQRDLASFRKQIALYREHHDGRWPAQGTESGDLFAAQLGRRTTHTGTVTDDGRYGPYLFGPLPENPWTFSSRVLVVAGPLRDEHCDGRGSHGWAYSSTTGDIRASIPPDVIAVDGRPVNAH